MSIRTTVAATLLACLAWLGLPAGAQTSAQTSTQSSAQSAEPWKVAVISLIGDEMHVVRYRGQTGTQLAPTLIETFPNPDPMFENLAMATATKALREVQPAVRVSEVSPPKPGSDADPSRLLTATGRIQADNPVWAALRANRFTHAVVLAKQRSPANLAFVGTRVGAGQLQGLGFYIDSELNVRNATSGEVAQGFIAPFAYLRATWIDVGRLEVLASETVTASYSLSATAREGLDPWSALTAAQKVNALRSLIERSVTEVMPKLVNRR